MRKRKVSDEELIESYQKHKNIWKVGEDLDICGQSVYERLEKIGVLKKMNLFSKQDFLFLSENYEKYCLDGKLSELAEIMGRTKNFICRKASLLGLTNIKRKKKSIKGYNFCKPKWNNNHPKGMLNKKHSAKTKEIISQKSKISHQLINSDADKRFLITKKMIETKIQNGNYVLPRKASWKGGWREIGGIKKYYRSRWEANYARYLEFLLKNNEISKWEHEPDTFWFNGIKRGCVSYLPDFKVTNKNQSIEYHEVKGYMDDRSKTKIKRMSIYHPQVKLLIIDKEWFKKNSRQLSKLITGWK